MKRIIRKRAVHVGLIAAALFAFAAGIAYATIPDANGVYTACKLNATGTIRLIDPAVGNSSLLGHCTSVESQISWNQQGQPGPAGPAGKDGTNGKDGVSVISAPEPAGANCANGGSAFTSASGKTYACTGSKGDVGPAGPAGGISGYERQSFTYSVPTGLSGGTAYCSSGKKVLGGGIAPAPGYDIFQGSPVVLYSGPSDNTQELWDVVLNNAGAAQPMRVWVICADAT